MNSWREQLKPVATQQTSSREDEKRAVGVFGRRKYDALVNTFKREANGDIKVYAHRIEFMLRSNGLCPSKKEATEAERSTYSHGSKCTLNQFLDIAIQCESVSNTYGLTQLIDFFAPFDLQNHGCVKENVFRQLMLHCGESFSKSELEEVIEVHRARGKEGYVDYRGFITAITGT